MKGWILLVLGMVLSWHLMDVHSESVLLGFLIPILFILLAISALMKLAWQLGPNGSGLSRWGSGGSHLGAPESQAKSDCDSGSAGGDSG